MDAPVLPNVAAWMATAYALLWIATLYYLKDTFQQPALYIGMVILLISYGLLVYYYSKRFLQKPSQYWDERALIFGLPAQLGFGGLSLYFILNTIGIFGIVSKWYDIIGAVGYGLFAFAKPFGIYIVSLYLLLAVVMHWKEVKVASSLTTLRTIARLMILVLYISVIYHMHLG
jgi:hypothetical protein